LQARGSWRWAGEAGRGSAEVKVNGQKVTVAALEPTKTEQARRHGDDLQQLPHFKLALAHALYALSQHLPRAVRDVKLRGATGACS
jgi:hypothetical protein